jgi:CBS domain-containing protein
MLARERRSPMKVSEFMETGLLRVPPATSLANLAREMERRHVDCAVVTDWRLAAVGIVTATDLVRHLAEAGKASVPVEQIMSRSVWAVDIDADVEDALAVMDLRGIHHVLVVDFGGYPTGMLFRDELVGSRRDDALTVDDALQISAASSVHPEHTGVGG